MSFDLGSVVAHIKADISDFQGGLNKAKTEMNGFSETVGNGLAAIGKVAAVAGVAVAGALVAGAKSGLDAAAKFEQYGIAFRTLLKDEQKAAEAIKNIQEDAKKTPFEMAPLIKGNQLLISAGASAEDARKDILNLGNAISATGGGTAELERLAVNMQQIKAVGKASALDIKQFAFAGINIYKLLSDSTGKTVEQVKEMDITYEDLTKSLEKASAAGGQFEGAMEAQSRSMSGLMSTFKDTLSIGLKDLVMDTGLFDLIKNGLNEVIPFIETKAVPAIKQLIAGIKEFAQSQFVADVIASIGAALNWLGQTFQDNQGTIQAVINEIVNFFTNYLMPAVNSVISFIAERWVWISQIISGVWEVIKGVIQLAWAIVYGLLKIGLAILAGDWGKAWDAVKEMLANAWEGIKKIFGGIVEFIKGWGGIIVHELTKPFEEAWGKIKETVNKIKDALDFTKRHSPSVVDIVKHGVGQVNRALSDLVTMPDIGAPQMAASVVGGQSFASSMPVNVAIDLSGAVISDEAGAATIGELIGDSIIKKLQQNIKF